MPGRKVIEAINRKQQDGVKEPLKVELNRNGELLIKELRRCKKVWKHKKTTYKICGIKNL